MQNALGIRGFSSLLIMDLRKGEGGRGVQIHIQIFVV